MEQLKALLGSESVLGPEQLTLRDPGIDPENLNGPAGVAPQTSSEISALLRWCNKSGVPVIPQGGRTGLSGAASASGKEILLFSHRIPKDIQIDAASSVAEVSASVTLSELETAANAEGLSVGIDLAARDSATLGGMVSTNAGGQEAFRNGTMRQRVLGLQAVLPDGSILNDLARVQKNNEGYDIKQLLIGAEGSLGFITRLTLSLVAKPPETQTFLLACKDAAAALKVLERLSLTEGLTVLRAEAMWRDFAFENARGNDLSHLVNFADSDIYIIFDVHTPDDSAEGVVFEAIEDQLESGLILDLIAAQSLGQAKDIWHLREDTFSIQNAFPHGLWFDVAVPRARLDEYIETVETRVAAIDQSLRVFAIAHLADGNVHYTIADPNPISPTRAQEIKDAVLDGVKEFGGSFSAEHGIGVEKKGALLKYSDPTKLALMRNIKTLLDPNNICNPGKIFAP